MQSLLNTAVNFTKTSGRVMATLAVIALSMATLKDKAHALTISAGTATVVGLPAAVRSSKTGVLADQKFFVVYTTADATSYSIMLASQTLGAAAGGSGPGWSLTTLFSTAVNASNSNIAAVMDAVVLSDGRVVVYFYDAALGHLRVISGYSNAAPFFPLSVATATIAGIQVINDNGGNNIKCRYCPQTKRGSNYDLPPASFAVASLSSDVGTSAVLISSAGESNASGSFYAVKAVDTNNYRIYYYDSLAGALREVQLNSSDAPVEGTRSTIDSGVITNIFATDAGSAESAVTRVLYTVGGGTVRYAVQRRHISGNCWYVQKIDDGSGSGTIALNGGDPSLSYIQSGSLRLARGVQGTFFDDFKENIVNTQLGIGTLISNVTRGSILQVPSGAQRDRGVYFPSNTNAIATFNWTSLRGSVVNSFGTAVPSVAISDTITSSSNLVNTAAAATLSPAASGNLAGGITNGSGAYEINIASGAHNAVSASSTSWSFMYQSSRTLVSVSTLVAVGDQYLGTVLNHADASFIAFSSPSLSMFDIDGTSQRTSTFSVAFMETLVPSSYTFNVGALNNFLSDHMTRSMNFRLVPAGVTVQNTTAAFEAGSIELSGVAGNGTSAVISTNTIWSRFSSTDTSLPITYTLVASSRIDNGPLMLGTLSGAVVLRGVEINFTSVTAGAINTLPGYSSLSSTGLINTSTHTTIIFRSTYSNIYSSQLVQYGNLHLTTSTTLVPGVSFTGDIPMKDAQVLGNGATVYASASILGLNTNATWYVRISSMPVTLLTSASQNSHVALSQPINFYPPVITSVLETHSQDSTIIFSSAAVRFSIHGSGFIQNAGVALSTIAFSTSTSLHGTGSSPHVGLPIAYAGSASSFSVLSSTFMTVDYLFSSRVSSITNRYHVFYGTATQPGLTGNYSAAYGGVWVSTILVNPTLISSAGVILMSTPAITSVDISTVSNTRRWTLTLRGRGLLAGSTVGFYATDGSTALPPVVTNETSLGSIGVDGSTTVVTVTVDFRTNVAGNKNFYIQMSSKHNSSEDYTANYAVSSTNTLSIVTGPLVFCSSMNVSGGFLYPMLNGQTPNTIFNSTGASSAGASSAVTLRLSGHGLVHSSTIQIVNVSSAEVVNQTSVMSSTGAFATFASTSYFKAPAGTYTVNVSSLIHIFGTNALQYSADASTTISISETRIDAASLTSHSAAYSTLRFASYTVTGAGILPHVNLFLNNTALAGHDRIGATASSATAANYNTVVVGFDLRAATVTSGVWEIAGYLTDGSAVGSTMTLTNSAAGSLTISTIPFLGVIPTGTRTNATGDTTINLSGIGLIAGASVYATHNGSLQAVQTTQGTTDYVGSAAADVSVRIGTIAPDGSTLNGGGVASQTTAQVTINLAGAAPSTLWVLQMATDIAKGDTPYEGFGGTAPQPKDDVGVGLVGAAIRRAVNGGTAFQSITSSFTVSESSAPNKVTGLTVLSASVATVTLRWVAPGDNGNTESLTSGSNFIVYYSSGNGDRGTGCAPCYPVAANGEPGMLTSGASNFTFANTWAQHLPVTHGGLRSTTTFDTPGFNTSTSNVRGLSVSTQTISISAVTIRASTDGAALSQSSINPGQIVEATLTIDAGDTAGQFWFVVRAQDEAGNLSPTDVVYGTASAVIGASPQTATNTIDPNVTTTLTALDIGGGISSGGSIPPGSLDGADTLVRSADNNPPADSGGADIIGPAVDITLGSGNTQFKKAITLTFTLSGAALAEINSKTSNLALVKVAFFNGSRWVLIRESSFDGTTVSCQVTHLTKFAVAIAAPASNLASATVYPNPYKPSVASQLAQGITFDSVPANTTIAIYTLAGDQVRTIKDDNGDGIVAWNGKNENGEDVASGVYFALLKGGGDTKTLKVAVQR